MQPQTPVPVDVTNLVAWLMAHRAALGYDAVFAVFIFSAAVKVIDLVCRFFAHWFPRAARADKALGRFLLLLDGATKHWLPRLVALMPKGWTPPAVPDPMPLAVTTPATPPAKQAGFAVMDAVGLLAVLSLVCGFFVLLATAPGCCHFTGTCKNTALEQDAIDCAKTAGGDVFQAVKQALLSGHGPEGEPWQDYLAHQAEAVGEEAAVQCAVHTFLGTYSAPASGPASAAAIDPNAVDRAQTYLAEHPARFTE